MAFMIFNPYAVEQYLTSFARCFKKLKILEMEPIRDSLWKLFKKVVISQRLDNTNSNLKGLGSSSSLFLTASFVLRLLHNITAISMNII